MYTPLFTAYFAKNDAIVRKIKACRSYSDAHDQVLDYKELSLVGSDFVSIRKGRLALPDDAAISYKDPDEGVRDGAPTITSVGGSLLRVGSAPRVASPGSKSKIRMHHTGGDLPKSITALGSTDPLAFVREGVAFLKRVAAQRACNTNAKRLSHPVLVWQDADTGSFHWFAIGYDVIALPLVRGGVYVRDSKGSTHVTPIAVYVSPYSPYEGLWFDVALCGNYARETAGVVKSHLSRVLEVLPDVCDDPNVLTKTIVSHYELSDPPLVTNDEWRQLATMGGWIPPVSGSNVISGSLALAVSALAEDLCENPVRLRPLRELPPLGSLPSAVASASDDAEQSNGLTHTPTRTSDRARLCESCSFIIRA